MENAEHSKENDLSPDVFKQKGEINRAAHEWADVFKVLADETRLSMLLLFDGQDVELATSHIVNQFGYDPSYISWHLMKLKTRGLLDLRKRGRHTFYSLTPKGQVLWKILTKLAPANDENPQGYSELLPRESS